MYGVIQDQMQLPSYSTGGSTYMCTYRMYLLNVWHQYQYRVPKIRDHYAEALDTWWVLICSRLEIGIDPCNHNRLPFALPSRRSSCGWSFVHMTLTLLTVVMNIFRRCMREAAVVHRIQTSFKRLPLLPIANQFNVKTYQYSKNLARLFPWSWFLRDFPTLTTTG